MLKDNHLNNLNLILLIIYIWGVSYGRQYIYFFFCIKNAFSCTYYVGVETRWVSIHTLWRQLNTYIRARSYMKQCYPYLIGQLFHYCIFIFTILCYVDENLLFYYDNYKFQFQVYNIIILLFVLLIIITYKRQLYHSRTVPLCLKLSWCDRLF